MKLSSWSWMAPLPVDPWVLGGFGGREAEPSRKHARIYRQGEQFLVEDLGSVNGTIVNAINGASVRLNAKSPRVLSAGDELKLGGTTLKFMLT